MKQLHEPDAEPFTRIVRRAAAAAIVLLIIASLGSCAWPWARTRADGEAPTAFYLETGRDRPRELTYTLDLGETPADVYFAFVNYSTSNEADAPQVNGVTATMVPQPRGITTPIDGPLPIPLAAPEITAFNNGHGAALVRGVPRALRSASPSPRSLTLADVDTATAPFWQYRNNFSTTANAVQVTATLRSLVTDGETGMRIWVHDDWWSDTTGASNKVTREKVDVLATAFFTEGPDNDIYDWVTTLLGDPFGPHQFSNIIDPERTNGMVDILLVDILQDDSLDGGIAGFFWAKDLFTSEDTSNERLMFYLDAPLYAQLADGGWSPDDRWPQIIISTLAHEFQHMIHHYRKYLSRGARSETWFNEMLSLVTEDLVARKLGIDGPRGVDPIVYSTGDSGPSDNTAGRLPTFVGAMETGVIDWPASVSDTIEGQEEVLARYAATYAYGAYLARAHGGAALVSAMMDGGSTDYEAVDDALAATGSHATFRRTLSGWAASALLSDIEVGGIEVNGEAALAAYNTGGWIESEVDSTTYRLGSINLYNYVAFGSSGSLDSGPQLRTLSSLGSADPIEPGAAAYVLADAAMTGTHRWDLWLDANTDLVVVVKPASD